MKGIEGATARTPLRQGLPSVDLTGASGSVSCALPARYEAVRSAREFTRVTLRHWQLPEQYDNVALVVSELVTNALRHGLTEQPDPPSEPPVRLHLMRWSSRLVCTVRDFSPAAPVVQRLDFGAGLPLPGMDVDADSAAEPEAACTQESGRGLCLVESFSDSWGWQPMAGASPGKVVWALFRL